MSSWWMTQLWPISFLLIAVVDDLLFRKFHNWLFITLTLVGVFYVFTFSPIHWSLALGGFWVGGLLMLPLVLVKAIGAGDMKFMMAFGLLLGVQPIFWVFVYALIWGAVLGLLQSLLSGQFKLLIWKMASLFQKMKPHSTHKIPYTVAILFGWLTWLQAGGLL